MNLLLLKSNTDDSELIEFMHLVLGKYKVIEIKEVNAYNVYISLSQSDESDHGEQDEQDYPY